MTAKEDIQKKLDQDLSTDQKQERFLIVHNDDYHTFDYVIASLIEICDHDLIQAEQCTFLIHYKGKCDVKKGSFTYLSPMRKALSKKDLKATID